MLRKCEVGYHSSSKWSMRRRMSHGGSSPQKPAALRSESFRHSIDLQKDRALDVNDACVQRQAKVFERMHRESEDAKAQLDGSRKAG